MPPQAKDGGPVWGWPRLLISAPSGAALPVQPCCPAALVGQATEPGGKAGQTGRTAICR